MELEFKGTKGEWHIKEKCASILDDNGKSVLCWNGVATSTFEEDEVVLKANSKLIASAPDLLEALKLCIGELYMIHSVYGDKANALENSNALRISEKAIEKALK